ncbi:hypothetical protein C6A77_07110 [Pseudomonas sp. AFG_SD02_1510_Pfu_092]|uniref:NEL-type E3 ubiquitin ligase domain-containing protein n=1 Tax=Pseudomonas sp. AFG_SD02_1510_Pfu_092 TaxID=2259497 RepID=UPI000DEF4C41|nr:NEL-type E3 ubiquitin ligase domain-containing protein [Pseudomonas sp. AFG_SD02_1510_Pfu_092]RCL28372.1 hypothetical protein C6A77_07110 [Pseudomonas sp. AFG_SD02_1510_Pfu_092]
MSDYLTGPDHFIAARLPAWLKRASRAQISTLRISLNAHHASQARLRGLTQALLPLPQFAEKHLTTLLDKPLPDGQAFAQLEWLQVQPRFGRQPGTLQLTYEYSQSRENGLLRLMRNFPGNTTYYDGTGLVQPGRDRPLNASLDTLIAACRALDVGRRYQDELERIFHPAAQAILAEDKRSGLRLATEVAALQGHIRSDVQIALRELAGDGQVHRQGGLKGHPGLLEALGQAVADGLLITLRDEQGNARGVVLFLPSDPEQALRYFDDDMLMNEAMAQLLQKAAYRQYFIQLISLEHRAVFADTLAKRVQDAQPDLQLEGVAGTGAVFTQLASLQVQRIKQDARLLLVSTADADSAAARARREAWQAAGLDLVNLAGFFIPTIGALLLGQWVVQTCSEVFEGVAAWSRGHQHEALEHMLGVAETLAATATTVAAVSFVRSAFVESMEPVSLGGGRSRLWHFEPADYESTPGTIALRSDGLFGVGGRRWARIDGHYLEVHRPLADGPYRLRGAAGSGGYGPVVLHNGERGWRLMREQPLTWQAPARMLDALWPQHPPLNPQRAWQVLQVAGVDLDELRGVLVENRTAPVNLRQTLQAFEAQARIDTFFERLDLQALMPADSELLAWCELQPEVGKGLERVQGQATALRPRLFAHLTQQPVSTGPLAGLVRQAFPGLPWAYVDEVVSQADEHAHEAARVEQRLLLSCAEQARSALRLARLNRALAGLYLSAAYNDETGALVLALLDSLELEGLSIALHEGAVDGRLIHQAGAGGQGAQARILVRDDGRFRIYNGLGEEQVVALGDPGCIFEAIVAALTPAQKAALQLVDGAAMEQLREQLLMHLPASHRGVARLLRWPESGAWLNLGHCLDDGRVGYLLSGRPSTAASSLQVTVRERLRALYPGLDDQALAEEERRLQRGTRPLLERLVELEDDHEQLTQHLNRWVGSELQESRQSARRATADSILRAWRLQGESVQAGEGRAPGQRLSLRGSQLRTLPALPPQIDFHRVTVLSVNDSLISDMPVDFLRPFSGLTELNLGNNQLLRLPSGIAYLPTLRVLRLGHNQIRLDAQAVGILQALPDLTHLDLSYNRVESLDLRFHHLSRLVSLNLRHCRLGAWPQRLELCGLLERADLRDNQLRTVPYDILQMPYAFRRAILVERNPLSALQVQGLYALDVIDEHGHLPEASTPVDLPAAQALWVGHVEAAQRPAREALWQRLLVLPDSGGLFRLLARLAQTADYQQAGEGRTALAEGVWSLLVALDEDPVLCRRLFERAGLPLPCSDAVASRFSALQVLLLQAQAEAGQAGLDNRSALLQLGRQLFRLEQLERVAYQDCRQRQIAGEHFDQLALILGYRVRLRERLQLPAQPYAMRYPDAAELTQAQLDDAFQRVTQAQTLEALTDSLSQREFWRRYLRREHGRMFDALSADYVQRTLRVQAQQPALTPLERQALLDRLQEQELIAVERLVSGLTQSYLQATGRGGA